MLRASLNRIVLINLILLGNLGLLVVHMLLIDKQSVLNLGGPDLLLRVLIDLWLKREAFDLSRFAEGLV